MWIQATIIAILIYFALFFGVMWYAIKNEWFEELEEDIKPDL